MINNLLQALEKQRCIHNEFDKSFVNISPVLEAIRLAPTAFGLQPFYIRVVSNGEKIQLINSAATDQTQVTDYSQGVYVILYEY